MGEVGSIEQTILDVYQALSACDETAYRKLVHPKVRTVNIGNSGEIHIFDLDQIIEFTINGLKGAIDSVPGFFARWEKIEFIDVTIGDVTASVETSYQMTMPDSTGSHHSFVHLVKEGERWLVINIIDRGIEQTNEPR